MEIFLEMLVGITKVKSGHLSSNTFLSHVAEHAVAKHLYR